MREFDLRLPVARWMRDRNLYPIMEMYSMRNCDMTGIHFTAKPVRIERIVCVELKLYKIAEVICQSQAHIEHSHETWCALPKSIIDKRGIEMFQREGVGLLVVHEGRAVAAVQSPDRTPIDAQRILRTAWRRRNEYLKRMTDKWMRKWPPKTT